MLDLPVTVVLELRVGLWRCCNGECGRVTFVEQLSDIVASFGRRSPRVIHLMRLLGYVSGGRQGANILERLAMPASDNTVL